MFGCNSCESLLYYVGKRIVCDDWIALCGVVCFVRVLMLNYYHKASMKSVIGFLGHM